MKSSHQLNCPDEITLEQKRAVLAALRTRHARSRADLQQVREDIARFERNYQQLLGCRIAELERIEAEILRLTGYTDRESRREESASCHASDHACGEGSSADEPVQVWRTGEKDIKGLYREVAKAIHPDLAAPGPAKDERHELMSKANRAYAEDDRSTLQKILSDWRRTAPDAGVEDVRAEFIRLTREIARERKNLQGMNDRIDALKGSYLFRFKARVDDSIAHGGDLLADMVDAVEINIARALRRLDLLYGESPRAPWQRQRMATKRICFPDALSCGMLYLRKQGSLDYSQWKALGPASGCLEVDIDKAVRLDIKKEAGSKLGYLAKLHPGDLQSLFLYEIIDSDLDSIVHLTGLEEIYLSGTRLTDAALSRLSSLTNLQRIFLYHTQITDRGLVHLQHISGLRGLTSSGNSITEEGLAVFQRAIPKVKTVSFQWKR